MTTICQAAMGNISEETTGDWVMCSSGESPADATPGSGSKCLLTASLVSEFSQYSSASKGPVFAVLSLIAPPEAEESRRAPVRLAGVIDKSGSMSGPKLELVKATTEFMSNQLTQRDMLGLVAYDSDVEDVMEMSSMTPENKATAKSRIGGIYAGSTTNLSGGLFRGVSQQLEAAKLSAKVDGYSPSVVRSVFLLTDGLPNVGISDPEVMVQMVQGMTDDGILGPNEKLRVNTFGFGNDHDPELLSKIAQGCGGAYYYIESEEQVPVVFGEALGGLLSTTCQNVEVTITPTVGPGGARLKRLRTNYSQEELPDGSFRVIVGDLFADERKDLVLEAELQPASSHPATADDNNGDGPGVDQILLRVNVRYLDVVACQPREASAILTIQRPAEVDQRSQKVSELVQFHRARIAASQALQDAQAAADRGNLTGGRQQLADMISHLGQVQSGLGSSSDMDLTTLQADLHTTLEKFSDREVYNKVGKHRACMLSNTNFDQRSYGAYKGSSRTYVTARQAYMSASVVEAASPMLSGPPAPVVSPPAAPSAAAQLPKGSKKMSKFAVGFIKPFRSKGNTQNQH